MGWKDGKTRCWWANPKNETYIPVSYTHLDVYKRQVCGTLIESNATGRKIYSLSTVCALVKRR